MRLARALRGIALTLLVAVLALAVFTARQISDGEAEMKKSDAAFDAGELRDATLHARRAAIAYAPGAPHVLESYTRLEAIAIGAEVSGRPVDALAAWRAIRSAALETRHVWVVEGARLERANREIARLQARAGGSEGHDDATAQQALAALQRDDAPTPLWLGLLVLGFALALGGLGAIALRGVSPDGVVSWRRASPGVVLALLGALLWTVAVWKA